MKKQLEKASLLFLSFMFISSFAIAPALPLMREHFQGYSSEQVDVLISVPSFFVMLMLLANGLLQRYLKERQIIILGLGLMTLSGLVPFFNQDYLLILISRMCFGLGIGTINAKAISIISERYTGQERIQMLGLRGASEVVGAAFLTMVVGQLIQIAWHWAFLIYGCGCLILLAYLLFVPQKKEVVEMVQAKEREKLSPQLWKTSLSLAFVAAWTICVNSSISLRVPVVVTELGIGDASDASLILSLQQLIGVSVGVVFAPMLNRFGQGLLSVSIFGFALTLAGVGLTDSLVLLGIATVATGFFYSVLINTIFHRLSERVPTSLLNTATAIVLLGCNSGGAFSPYVIKVLEMLSSTSSWIFLFYAVTGVILAILLWGRKARQQSLQ